MAIRKRNNTWYMYWKENGRVIERTLGTCSEDEARASEASLRQMVAARRQASRLASIFGVAGNGQQSQQAQTGRKNGVRLEAMIEIAAKRIDINKLHTLYWGKLCKGIGVKYAVEVTPQMAQKWLDANFGDKSAKTYNNALCACRVIYNKCLVDCGLASSPFEHIQQRRLNDVEHYRDFTKEEQKAIFSFLNGYPYWLCLTTIAAYTGLRLESCRRLAPEHISEGLITILPGKTARFGRKVAIPVLPVLGEYLSTLSPATPETPFCEQFPEQAKMDGVLFYTAVLNRLGITANENGKVGFHAWRTTFSTWLGSQGVSDRVMRGVMGHNSERMQDLYNHDTELARKEFSVLGGGRTGMASGMA